AEDGIRDFHVTGVQTCALPIYSGALFTANSGGLLAVAKCMLAAAAFARGSGGCDWRAAFLAVRARAASMTLRKSTSIRSGWPEEIGRASCRERGWASGGGGSVK